MSDEIIDATITEPAVLLVISQSYDADLTADELCEATCKEWVLSPSSHKPRFAFSVAGSLIRQVYRINS